MRIGLFGGSFNPPHVCHILATIWGYETRSLDEIWWLPTDQHAFDKALEPYRHRRRMCERAVDDYSFVRVVDIEQELEGRNHTVDTVRELRERRPDDAFALLVGSDILAERDDWKEWEELVDLVELIVVGRRGTADAGTEELEFALPDVSSTRVRRAIRDGDRDWLDEWIPRDVLAYIEREGLYRE